MNPRLSSWLLLLFAVLGLAILAALTFANLRFTEGARDANAFLPRWAGAHAWLTQQRSPYDPQVSLNAQTTLYGRPANPAQGEDRALFAHPLPVMLFYAGFGLLDYPVGRAVWMTLLELALPLSALLAIRLSGSRWPAVSTVLLLIVSLAWSPGVRAVVAGSAAPLALLFGLTSLLLAQRHWDLAAGVVLALAMVDPLPGLMLFVAVCIWGISNRHRMLPIAAAGAVIILVAASLVLLPEWPIGWLRQLASWVGLGTAAPPPSDWPVLQPGRLPEVALGVLILASFWSWWPRVGGGTRTLVWTAAFTLVVADWVGLLLLGRASLVYLLLALVLILGVLTRRGHTTGSWLGIIGIGLVALASWAPALLSVEGEGFGVAGASIGLFAAALGLLWVRWWVTRGAEIRTYAGEPGADG